MGRSPNIGELKLLRREADMIQQQDKIIPFPGGGKDKVSPFKPRPTPETEAEMLERMNRQNKESVERLKKKKEKDLGDKLKDFDGDPDAMAMGGRAGFKAGGILDLLKMLQGKVGKKNITTADKIARPESALNREMFDEANKRFNKKVNERTSNKSLLKAMDEVGGNFTGDLKYDADVLADEIAFQRGLIPEGGDLTDIADQMKRMDLYDEAYSALSQQFLKQREIRKLSKPTKTLKSIEDTGSIDISNDEVAEEFANFMKRNDPEGYEKLEGITDKINSKTRTDNAEGGRIGMLAGGSVLKLMLQNMAKERGVKPSSLLELMNIKSLPKEIRDRLSPKEIKEFLDKRLEQVKNFKDMMETKLNFNQAIDKGKNLNEGLTSDIFEYFDDTFSKGNPVPRSVDEKSVLEMEQMIKNMEMKDRKLNAQGGLNYLMGL